MVKFKLRIFKSCQTNRSSTPPEPSSPPSQRHKVITADSSCTTSPPPSKQASHRSSFKSHLSFAFRCVSKSFNNQDLQSHVVSKHHDVVSPRLKICNSGEGKDVFEGVHGGRPHMKGAQKRFPSFRTSEIFGPTLDEGFRFPLLPVPPFYDKKTRGTRKVKTTRPKSITADSHRFSTSYSLYDNREDKENPSYPHRSFSDVGVRSGYKETSRGGQVSPEWGSPTRLSVFKKLMPCKVEGKVKESFVVVKRSEKPYEDFKKSMMEMIVENEIYEESDLKQLLQCFLSLNSWYHHGVIMEAFSEIWKNVFVD